MTNPNIPSSPTSRSAYLPPTSRPTTAPQPLPNVPTIVGTGQFGEQQITAHTHSAVPQPVQPSPHRYGQSAWQGIYPIGVTQQPLGNTQGLLPPILPPILAPIQPSILPPILSTRGPTLHSPFPGSMPQQSSSSTRMPTAYLLNQNLMQQQQQTQNTTDPAATTSHSTQVPPGVSTPDNTESSPVTRFIEADPSRSSSGVDLHLKRKGVRRNTDITNLDPNLTQVTASQLPPPAPQWLTQILDAPTIHPHQQKRDMSELTTRFVLPKRFSLPNPPPKQTPTRKNSGGRLAANPNDVRHWPRTRLSVPAHIQTVSLGIKVFAAADDALLQGFWTHQKSLIRPVQGKPLSKTKEYKNAARHLENLRAFADYLLHYHNQTLDDFQVADDRPEKDYRIINFQHAQYREDPNDRNSALLYSFDLRSRIASSLKLLADYKAQPNQASTSQAGRSNPNPSS